jgi:hypothetical protein
MNVEIGTETPIFLLWEYLFQNVGIVSLQCIFSFEYSLRINTIFTALKLYFNKSIYLFRVNMHKGEESQLFSYIFYKHRKADSRCLKE